MDVATRGTVVSPIAQVWEIVSDFTGLALWHPLIERCEAQGSHVGARRTVYFSDRTVVERLDECNEVHHAVAYSVVDSTRPETIGLSARITLAVAQPGLTSVEWRVRVPSGRTQVAADLSSYYLRRLEHLQCVLTARVSGSFPHFG